MPGLPPPAFPIQTDRLVLRPFEAEDLDALHDLRSRPDVTRYLYWEPSSRDEVRRELDRRIRHRTLEREGETLHLAMVLRDGGAVIGDVSMKWLSREGEQGEVGFVVHPDHHGRGLAGEAARAMLQLGFEQFGFHRIIGRCDGRNDASARLMRRLGMRHEAHFRENGRFKGEWGDELVFAMLAAEWDAGGAELPAR